MASYTSSSVTTTSSSSTRTQQMAVLREVTVEAKSTSSRTFGSSMDESFKNITSIELFLDYIAAERLRRMPHRGSKWDRVLAYAAYFASQTQLFASATGEFVSHSQEAARVVWANLHLLLKMGPEYVNTLERLFVVYYSMGSTLSSLVQYQNHFVSSTEVQQSLAIIFSNVVRLVVGVASQFGQAKNTTSTAISSEIYRNYGGLIESTYARRDQIFNMLWQSTITTEVGVSAYKVDVEEIRSFLSPSDRIVRTLTSSALGSGGFRAEHTCEWMQSSLMEFVRGGDKVMVIQGKPGTGKTFLAGWIAERLQRAEGRKAHHEVISFSIEKDICTQTSTVAVAKGLLIQLLDRNVGNINFYRMLCDVMETYTHAKSTDEAEASLWRAVDTGLASLPNTMIIVDGLDQISGGETSGLKLLERLSQLGMKHTHIRAIAMSQPLTKAAPQRTRSFTIEPDNITRDVRYYLQDTLSNTTQFRNVKESDRERIVQRISTSSEGSFILAVYSLELLKREKTVSGMLQLLDSLPKTVQESLTKVQSLIDLQNMDTRSLLAWLLASQRPLTLDEIRVFFEIDLGSCSHKPRFSEVEQDVLNAVGPIVSISNGVVRFRHDTLRTHFLALAGAIKDYSNTGSFPFMVKEAHYDLSTRCLAYVKLFVTRRVDVVFGRIQPHVLSDLYEQYPAFEYAATYWLSHFHQSPMYDPSGKHKLVPEFRNCFPESTLLVQVEGSIWPTFNTVDFELSLFIRQTVLGQQTMAVLQNIIIVARTLEILVSYQKASTYYYQAYTLTQTLVGEETTVLTRIAIAYLTVSTVAVTERNEVAIQRESMLKRVLTHYKETYGASYSTTVQYTRMLAQLYTDTKQFDLAVAMWQEVYEVYVQIYGEFHAETTKVYQTLETTLKKSTKKEDIKTVTRGRYETTQRELAVTDERRTTTEEEMISHYEEKKDYAKAESVLVDQWRSISETASTSRDTSIHKRKLDVTKKYIEFLKRQNRTEEARTILDGVATEYHGREMGSESMASSFQSLAEEMKSLSMFKSAHSVFSSLASYYQKTGKTSSSRSAEATRSLEETTEQLVQSSSTASTAASSTSTTTTTTTVADESTLTNMFESLTSLSSSTSASRFKSIIKTSQQLTLFHQRQQQYAECFRICSQALAIMWPYFITRQGTVRLPSEYQREVVELALRMGECTWAQRQIEKTEDIYVTVFKATKNTTTVKITDDLYSLVAQTLTDFYEQTYQVQKFLAINREIYNDQKTHLGANHKITIATAYRVASYCFQQGKVKDAEPYYYDVYTVLVTGGNFPVEAIPAAEKLLTIYDQDARWESAEKLCVTLWDTWTKRGAESRFHVDFVEKIYNVYSYVLQDVKKVNYEEIYKITKTYKETCQRVFGEKNELTLKATLQFAQICERSETRSKEALAVYEEACKHQASSRSVTTTTTTSTSSSLMQAVNIARSSLARMYTKEAVSSESASSFVNEEFESTRSAYGATHERSLESLSQVVEYNAKQNKTELTQKSTRMLQSSVVETIKTEKTTQKLVESATTLAQSYTKIQQKETAWELLREIRRQVITGHYTSSNKFNFSMEGTDRRSYTFIIAFSNVLMGYSATHNFSEYMADLMTETLLYQAYHKAITEKAKFEVTFDHGSRLSLFYQKKDRTEDYNRIWNELLELFAANMKASKTSATLKEFFEIVIAEINRGNYDTTIPQISAERILVKMQSSKFQEAYEMALYAHRFIELHGGWRSQQKVEAGLQICLHLMGRSETPKVNDQKLYASIVEISRTILAAVLHAARDLNVRFIQMPMKQINDIVALLGEQENYRDLEWLLSELWNSRHGQTSWDSVTIVWIGRRLVEVRFATGRRDAAVHLCEDITYNVRRVWGPSDQVTVQMYDLLAELHSAMGDHGRALAVHEEMLRQVIISVEDEGEITPEQGAAVAAQELELMKRSYQRNGGWSDKDGAAYKDLYSQLSSSFSGQKAFSAVQSVEKWNAKDKADNAGVWQKPSSFEFAGASTQTHRNHLRWTSGLVTSASRGHRHSSSAVNGS